jgi:hypothetical protein
LSPSSLFITAVLLQGLAILFDEFYFHHRRGLPKWERIGHPLDSLTVLVCFAFLIFFEPSEFNLWMYAGLAVFSCVFVTKDEAVHLKHCTAAENWLHSTLFILHPLVFIAAGMLWYSQSANSLLVIQTFVLVAFLIYQIGYWNFYAKQNTDR